MSELGRLEDLVAREIVDSAFAVHKRLGPGLLESVYEVCLAHELSLRNQRVDRQKAVPIVYEELRLDAALRLDLVVENRVIVELKAVEALLPVHIAQMLTYLKISGMRLGLLINFNVARIKDAAWPCKDRLGRTRAPLLGASWCLGVLVVNLF